LNKKKVLISILVLAILAFSSAATMVHATLYSSYSAMPWASNSLVTPGTLTIAGSSTVAPIAEAEEAGTGTANPSADNFVSYWNSLVAANPSWGTASALDLSAVSIAGLGSGTAVPALDGSSSPADVGEMSRPCSDGEWGIACMNNMQVWAVGVDSVAIVLSPDMTWFPTSLNTFQVSELFADNAPNASASQGLTGVTGSTPLYATWDDFLSANHFYSNEATAGTAGNATIQLAVRDATSGTFDCFNNYFVVPNGYQFEYKSGSPSTVTGTCEMAPFTYCEENSAIVSTVENGVYGGAGDYIGFTSLGYALSNPHTGTKAGDGLIPLNISFNMASPPSGKTASPLITYYGPSGTFGATSNSAYPSYNVYSWGTAVQPTIANVIWAYSGVQGKTATGQYEAWRWLWEVTPGPIPNSGPCLAAGVWISYMMEDDTTQGGTSMFVLDQSYIQLSRADMAGGLPLDSNLATSGTPGAFTVTPTQTQTIPDGKVNGQDFFYFVDAYIHYYANNIYNPYADIYATGKITGTSFLGFVAAYVYYFTTYNPTA
jgi:ABC-type phosphate transport system substrate-binding protein